MANQSDIVAEKLSAHEQVCAERYKSIEQQFRASNSRLKRIEVIGIGATATIMASMGWAIDLLIRLLAKG
jgi:hypothetical protein